MKSHSYSIPFFIFLLQGMLMIICCQSPCDDNRHVDEDQFGIYYPAVMPFSGVDTLRFLKNGTDTLIYVGEGKQNYYQEVQRPDNDCEVKYRLLNQTITFKNRDHITDLYLHYYIYSASNNWEDYFELKFGNTQIGPFNTYDMGQPYTPISVWILGHKYDPVKGYCGSDKNDSVYFNYTDGDTDPRVRIIKIVSQDSHYEILRP